MLFFPEIRRIIALFDITWNISKNLEEKWNKESSTHWRYLSYFFPTFSCISNPFSISKVSQDSSDGITNYLHSCMYTIAFMAAVFKTHNSMSFLFAIVEHESHLKPSSVNAVFQTENSAVFFPLWNCQKTFLKKLQNLCDIFLITPELRNKTTQYLGTEG